jgi:Protein of unknown function (DUF998)
MRNANLTHSAGATSVTIDMTARATRSLLTCGIVAGPFYVIVALIQGFTRPGFELLHDDVSLLSNGDLGWIQIANFLITGALVIAGAAGMRRVLQGSRAGTWGPLLIGLFGLGLIGAGIFVADPMNGFPPGSPAGAPAGISSHGLLHIVCAAVGFLGLIAACFVFARRFAALKERSWMAYSIATGLIFFASFAGVASGSSQAPVVIGFWIGVVLAFAWIAVMAARLRDTLPTAKS